MNCQHCGRKINESSRSVYYTADGDFFCDYDCYITWRNDLFTSWM